MVNRTRSPNGTPAYDKVMARSVWEGDCLVYKGPCYSNGYGAVKVPITRRHALAHRVVMEHHFGPSDLYVLHSCDNPPCVNVEHLRYGTQSDNLMDAVERGRKYRGRFTDEQIIAIRADTRPDQIIAEEYGTVRSYVSRIQSGHRGKR